VPGRDSESALLDVDADEAAGEEPVGLAPEDVSIRGGVGALGFVEGLASAGVVTSPPIEPMQIVDTAVDRRMDLDAIFAHGDWVGLVKPTRTKSRDELPAEVEEQMRELERQFILRNLGRAERFADPDEALPYEHSTVERLNLADAVATTRMERHAEPPLLDEMMIDTLRAEVAWRHHYMREMRWERHFGFEVRQAWTGPMWKFDPDDPEAQAALKAKPEPAADEESAG